MMQDFTKNSQQLSTPSAMFKERVLFDNCQKQYSCRSSELYSIFSAAK